MKTSDKRGPTERAFSEAEPAFSFYLHCELLDEDVPEATKD
jgi:hypothetical protein